jgi:hypothetical protein
MVIGWGGMNRHSIKSIKRFYFYVCANFTAAAEIEVQTSKRQGLDKYLHVFTIATLALILLAIRINKKQ